MIKIRKRLAIPAVLVMSITFALLMTTGSAMAADTHVEWQGVEDLSIHVQEQYSYAHLSGSNTCSGVLDASTGGHHRVEVDQVVANYNSGGYEFTQYNNLSGGPKSYTQASVSSDESGYIELQTMQNDHWNKLGPVEGWDLLHATGDFEMSISGSGGETEAFYVTGAGSGLLSDLGEDQPTVATSWQGGVSMDIEFTEHW